MIDKPLGDMDHGILRKHGYQVIDGNRGSCKSEQGSDFSERGQICPPRAIEEFSVGGFKAVIPELTGRAFVTGMHTFVMDEEDPSIWFQCVESHMRCEFCLDKPWKG